MKDRIILIMKRENMKPAEFAKAIGIQSASISHILADRNRPSLDIVSKILQRFKYVDSNWLLFGHGNMMKSDSDSEHISINRERIGNVELAENTTKQDISSPNIQRTLFESPVSSVVTPQKYVTKIMVFYSDNTFDTLVPEKQ